MKNFEPIIYFEEGWSFVHKGIKKLLNKLEGLPDTYLNSEDYIMLFTTIYNVSTAIKDDAYNQQLYEKYTEVIHEYITSRVLPSLQEKKDELLLRELLRRWSNHKTMTNRLSGIFSYLERFYIPKRRLPSLNETSFLFFYDLVYDNLNNQVKDAILAMIDRKIAGETVDETLVNNTLMFYSEIGDYTRKYELKEFVETIMKKTCATF